MFGGLAYLGHRMSQATIFLEERVMMEAKRRINANQVRSKCRARRLGGCVAVWGIRAPHCCTCDPMRAWVAGTGQHVILSLLKLKIVRNSASQGKLDAEYRAILGEKYYNKWFPEGTGSSD